MKVNSTVKMNLGRIKQLTRAQVKALEMTGEALHTDVEQAQVFPFQSGNTQNESTFVDYSKSGSGKVTLATNNPYARRLYFHPEYNFSKAENPNAKGKWYGDWMAGGKKAKFAGDTFKKLYKKVGGV